MSTKAQRKEQAILKAKRKKIIIITICAIAAVAIISIIVFTVIQSINNNSLQPVTQHEHSDDCDH